MDYAADSLTIGISAQNIFDGEVSGSGQYIVANANLYLQTKKYDDLNSDIAEKLAELQGYVENKSENAYDWGRSLSMAVRVPSENGKLDEFINALEKNGTITSRDVAYNNITDEMIETGSRKNALEAEEKALLEILEKAQTVDEIIKLRDRLSNVRGELESYMLKLQKLNNQVQYSTVYINIQEVEQIKAPSESFAALAGSGFIRSLKNVGVGIRGFIIGFIASIPYFVVVVAVAVPVLLIIKRIRKRKKATI